MHIILPLIAVLIFKEYIVLNQELIIYCTFLGLCAIAIYFSSHTLVNMFTNNRITIQNELKSSSTNIQRQYTNTVLYNKMYHLLNPTLNSELPDYSNDYSDIRYYFE